MQGPIPGTSGLVGLLLLLLSIAVLTVSFDRCRYWWQWWRSRLTRSRRWQESGNGADTDWQQRLAEWERQMAFGEPLLESAAVLAPLLGLIGTVLGLMQVLAQLGPGLTLPAGAPLAGYGRVLMATAVGLIVSLIATATLHANQAARRWQIASWQRRLHPTGRPAPLAPEHSRADGQAS
jgi:biopolymer transport protein ExbB